MSIMTKSGAALVICCAGILFAHYASSQQDNNPKTQNCTAPSVQQSPNGNNDPQVSKPAVADGTKLSGCEGVIKPPETGDSNLVKPAPPSSNMPVLKPKDLPNQQQGSTTQP